MFDFSEYTSLFLDEAQEQLESLNADLLLLEQGARDQEILHRIFRVAHNIKGAAGSLGFKEIQNLAHEMENILDDLRSEKLQVSLPLIDALFACLDQLSALRDAVARGEEPAEGSSRQLQETLRQLREKGSNAGAVPREPSGSRIFLTESDKNALIAAAGPECYTYAVHVLLAEDCAFPALRAQLVVQDLQEVGEIVKVVPDPEAASETFGYEFFAVCYAKEMGLEERFAELIQGTPDINTVEAALLVLQEVSDKEPQAVDPGGLLSFQEQVAPQPQATAGGKGQHRTVRVDEERLESLMNLVGELVIDRTRLLQISSILQGRKSRNGPEEQLGEIVSHLGMITGELQEEIMRTRMSPVEHLFRRFPRLIRDIAQDSGKEVRFFSVGEETELDRTLLDEINEPLIHILRNAVDHGLETPAERLAHGKPSWGTVRIAAERRENQIILTITDDGRGIDLEKLRKKIQEKGLAGAEVANWSKSEVLAMIYRPGFSTKEEVTAVSGRGVGMDAVREKVEKLNGVVDVTTEAGQGTTFTIKLPLTLAITQALLVRTGERVFAVPLVYVVEVLRLETGCVKSMQNREVVVIRGEVLPLLSLRALMDGGQDRREGRLFAVVVASAEHRVAIWVDALVGEQEIVIKPLSPQLGSIPILAGGTILGDGRVALVLDIPGLIQKAGCKASLTEHSGDKRNE